MKIDLACQPSYAVAYARLEHGEAVLVERGAMLACSDGITAEFGVGPGGVVKAALRKGLGGESFFMGRYTATVHGAWVALAPKYPGDIIDIPLDGSTTIVSQQGALLACGSGVAVDVGYAGVGSVLMREGVTLLKASGVGDVILGTYGAVQRFDLEAGQSMVVDTGHFVAMTDSCNLEIGLFGGVATAAATGEGIVARISGPGAVWVQTRAETALRGWLLPQRAQNSGTA